MPLRVVLGLPPRQIPPAAEAELRRRLTEIGASLDEILPSSVAIWESLGESTLQVDVLGWRVTYRVDRENSVILAESGAFVGTE